MIKNLGARLACRGKIKIGGLGEKRKSKAGADYRLPVKYDHFVITTNVRTKEGDLMVDAELMEKIGNQTEISVVLFGNSIEDVYDDWYAFYDGKKAICRGDGATATWKGDKAVYKALYTQLTPIANEQAIATTVQCAGDNCPLFKKEEDKQGCKLNFILRVILIDAPAVGGVYELRSTSINSALAMRASIGMLINVTGGQITGVPLKLKLSPKTVQVTSGQSTIYVTHLEYPGSFIDLKKAAIEQQKQVKMLDYSLVDAKTYQEWEDDHPDEVEAVTQEFYPIEPDPDVPKKSRMESIVNAQVVVDVVDTTTGEILPAEAVQSPDAPPNYEFLKTMKGCKKEIGDEAYYKILGVFKVKHSNEIYDHATQKKVWQEMVRFAAAVKELQGEAKP